MPRARLYAFHRGKLYIREGDAVMRIHPWPELWAQVRRQPGAGWEWTIPGFPVIQPVRRRTATRKDEGPQLELGFEVERVPDHAEKRAIAMARFRARFPKAMVKAVQEIREPQWHLLSACSRCGPFVELIGSNPALACLWVWEGLHRLPADLQFAARAPRKELLARLGLPGTKSALKFLGKCYVPAIDWQMCGAVCSILRDEGILARLRHGWRLGAGVAALARSPGILGCCTPSLIDEIAGAKDELYRAPTATRIENHLEILSELSLDRPAPFRSREEVLVHHRELIASYNADLRPLPRDRRRSAADFGPPPLPGTRTIEPIRSEDELAAEGRSQRNCARTYAERVRRGTHYLYRVSWPERCTLSIVNARHGWQLSELEAAGNRPAKQATWTVVEQWLSGTRSMLGGAGP